MIRILLFALICNMYNHDVCEALSTSNQLHNHRKSTLLQIDSPGPEGLEKVKSHILVASYALFLPLLISLPAEAADFFTHAEAQYSTLVIPQKYDDPRKDIAMKQQIDKQNLQDEKLDQCVEKGQDWEQCFMFGDSSSMTFADGQGNDWQKGLGIKIPFNNLRGPELPVPEQGSLLGGDEAAIGNISRKPPTW